MAAALTIRAAQWRWLPTFTSRLMSTSTDTPPNTQDPSKTTNEHMENTHHHCTAATAESVVDVTGAAENTEEVERVQGELLAKIKREHQEQCLYHDEEIKFHEEAISRHTESIERHRLLKSQHEATLRQHESEEKQAIYNERNGKKAKE